MHLTTVHQRTDTRIFIKQCATLTSEFAGSVVLVVADGLGDRHTSGIRVVDMGDVGANRLRRFVIGFKRSLTHLRVIRPTVLHFHDPELIPLGLLAKALGIAVIYDVHEDVPDQISQKSWIPPFMRQTVASLARSAERLAALSFDAIVPATPRISERFPDGKTVVVQNFPLESEVSVVNSSPYVDRPATFVYVGIISRMRGAVEMSRSIHCLRSSWNASLELIGTFSPSSLEEEIINAPGTDRIRFHQWLPRDEMMTLLMNARAGMVLFHPAPNHIYAQPNKLFEYMAAGLPVIASDFPLWREIVETASCGLLVDPTSSMEIAKAMQWVLENPNQAGEMGANGREAVMKRYNWTAEGRNLVDLYERILGARRWQVGEESRGG